MFELIGMMILPILFALNTLERSSSFRPADARTEFLVQARELFQGLFLVAIDLHDLLAGDHLLDEAVHPAQVPLPFHEILAGQLAQTRRHLVHQESHDDGDHRERNAQHEHAHERRQNRHERLKQVRNTTSNHLTKCIDVIRVHGHDIAVGMIVEVLERQRLHVGEQVLADAKHRPLPHVDHDEALRIAGNDADEDDGTQFRQGDGKRCIIRRRGGRHRQDVIVDEAAGEKG